MKNLLFCLMLCAAGGCTGYHARDWTGGYTETWLRKDALVVRFYGNGYTSMEQAEEMALLRAAELAVLHRYDNIAIMAGSSYIDVAQWTTGGDYYQTQGTVYMPSSGQGYVDLRSQYVEPTTITYRRPCSLVAVRCFDERPDDIPDNAPVLSSWFIFESLAHKYRVERLLAASDRQ